MGRAARGRVSTLDLALDSERRAGLRGARPKRFGGRLRTAGDWRTLVTEMLASGRVSTLDLALDSEQQADLRGARPKRFGGRMSYCRARRAGCAPIRREAMIDRSIPLGR